MDFLGRTLLIQQGITVSIQSVSSSVTTLSSGLGQIRTEIKYVRAMKKLPPEDRFLQVMEVSTKATLMIVKLISYLAICTASDHKRTGP